MQSSNHSLETLFSSSELRRNPMASKNDSQKKGKAKFGEGLGSFLFAVAAILAFRWALFEPYVIPSGSMIPTLLIHDNILVNKFAYGFRMHFSNVRCVTRV